jgi:hypothetical protein
LAIKFGICKRIRDHGGQSTGIAVHLGFVPHVLQNQELRFAWIGLRGLRPRARTNKKAAENAYPD